MFWHNEDIMCIITVHRKPLHVIYYEDKNLYQNIDNDK